MTEKKSTAAIDPELVRELAAILRDTGLAEIEVEHGETKLRLSRNQLIQTIPAAAIHAGHPGLAQNFAPQPQMPPQGNPPLGAPGAPAAAPAAGDPNRFPVPSPMVGTVYLSPEPGKPTFVKVGDEVKEGQTLLIVEAMKVMNPIAAPRAGKVVEIAVHDSQPVEFGAPLLYLA